TIFPDPLRRRPNRRRSAPVTPNRAIPDFRRMLPFAAGTIVPRPPLETTRGGMRMGAFRGSRKENGADRLSIRPSFIISSRIFRHLPVFLRSFLHNPFFNFGAHRPSRPPRRPRIPSFRSSSDLSHRKIEWLSHPDMYPGAFGTTDRPSFWRRKI